MRDIKRFLLWLLLAFIVYGPGLFLFDFWSDDFGYFLNFNNQLSRTNRLTEILASYLTGGVPRLQLGWHITHQILFLIFKNAVWGYFLIQVFIIAINSFLMEKFFKTLFGSEIAFWIGVFLIASPFYKESFYWVSANYGLFQIFFFLISFFLLEKSITFSGIKRYAFIICAALANLLACLFMEQSLPYLGALPIIFLIYHYKEFPQKLLWKTVILSTVFACIFFVGLYSHQLFVIKSSGGASLQDSINAYYPTPLESAKRNIPIILRWSFLGFLPLMQDFNSLLKNWPQIQATHQKLFLSACIFSIIFFFIHYFIAKRDLSKSSRVSKGFMIWFPILLVWFLASTVVVIPLISFLSRYVYIILPSALALSLWILSALPKRLTRIIFPTLAVLSIFDMQAFYFGSHFPLINAEQKVFKQIRDKLDEHPEVKAIALIKMPVTLNNAVSGVWLNYHAAEWWLNWRSKGMSSGIEMVGNQIHPELTLNGQMAGFRFKYDNYPKERMKKIYSANQVLIAEFKGSGGYDPDPKIELRIPKEFSETILDKPVKLTEESQLYDIYLPKEGPLSDLRDCYMDIAAEVDIEGGTLGITVFNAEGKYIDSSSGYGSYLNETGKSQIIFARTLINRKGHYFIRFLKQANPVNGLPKPDFGATIKNVQIAGCGKQYHAKKFTVSHNPDPNYPYIRFVSPQKNYSVTLAYPGTEIWEYQFGVGINDSRNRGDYYCFPDDVAQTITKSGKVQKAYVGMLNFDRDLNVGNDLVRVTFTRKLGDPLVVQRKLDIMSKEEFDSYFRDDLPLDIKVEHSFPLNVDMGNVKVTVTSKAKEPLELRWAFKDSAVFDFAHSNDLGVTTLMLPDGIRNQEVISSRKSITPDISVSYRMMYPYRYSMAAMEYSNSPFLAGHFVGDVWPQIFEKPQGIYALAPIPQDASPPYRYHGLVFKLNLDPGETKSFDYDKFFISGWYDEKELKELITQKMRTYTGNQEINYVK